MSTWDTARARSAVTDLRDRVDVLVVGLHAGVEYLKRPDPALAHIVDLVAGWGADVVWGHGAHAAYPVQVVDAAGRPAVVAPGLGNAVFDQRLPGTDVGGLLEVLVDSDGVIGMRDGTVAIDAGRTAFGGWNDPAGDAVALDGEWWSPVRRLDVVEPTRHPASADGVVPEGHDVAFVAIGDVTGTGAVDTVVAYRRPATGHAVHERFPGTDWIDGAGRSAHVAIYAPDGRMRWGSAFLFQPITVVAVCSGALAIGFSTLDDPAVVAGGVWTWDGFGFRTAPPLAGAATPACADLDHDGRLDPVLNDRDLDVRTDP